MQLTACVQRADRCHGLRVMETTLLKAFLTLAALVGVLGAALYVVRRYAAVRLSHHTGAQFRVIGQLSLQQKKQIYLLLVADTILVVGAADHSITTLSEITDPATVAALIEAKTPSASLSSLWAQPKEATVSSPPSLPAERPQSILSFSEFLKSFRKKEGFLRDLL